MLLPCYVVAMNATPGHIMMCINGVYDRYLTTRYTKSFAGDKDLLLLLRLRGGNESQKKNGGTR